MATARLKCCERSTWTKSLYQVNDLLRWMEWQIVWLKGSYDFHWSRIYRISCPKIHGLLEHIIFFCAKGANRNLNTGLKSTNGSQIIEIMSSISSFPGRNSGPKSENFKRKLLSFLIVDFLFNILFQQIIFYDRQE